MLRKGFFSVNESRSGECILVVKAVASSVETLLGCSKILKCCESSSYSILSSNTSKILEIIDVEHPAGYIINSACQSLHKEFGCGSTTLVCLIGYWAAALQNLVEMGVPVMVVVSLLNEITEELQAVLKRSCILLKTVQDTKSDKRFSKLHHIRKDFCQEQVYYCNAGANDVEDYSILKKPQSIFQPGDNSEARFQQGRLSNYSNKIGLVESSLNDVHQKDSILNISVNRSSKIRKNKSIFPTENSKLLKCTHKENGASEDEFDACFDGLALNEKTTRSDEMSSSNSDIVKKVEKKLEDYKLPDKHLSFERLIRNHEVPYMKSFKKTKFKNVLLRSRHLTDTLESSCQDYDTDDCDNSMVSRKPMEHQYKEYCADRRQELPYDVDCSTRLENESWLDYLGQSLAHGKDREMFLALEILKKQFQSSENTEFSFAVDLISVQTVFGPPVCDSCVIEGVVVELSRENQFIVACDSGSPKRIALINGNITYNYRHPGFKESVNVICTLGKDDFINSTPNAQKKWIDQAILVVKSLRLGVIALHGRMTETLRDYLHALGVIVLENLCNHQLDVLSKMTETSITSYLFDFTTHHLGKLVVIKVWNGEGSSGRKLSKSLAVQTVFGQVSLCPAKMEDQSFEQFQVQKFVVSSVVLCGPVQDLLDDSEQTFWNCVFRLRNAFEDRCVLPGGGDIEWLCIQHLEDIKDSKFNERMLHSGWIQEDMSEFRPIVIDAICSGLKEFVAKANSTVNTENELKNSSNLACSARKNRKNVFDNYSSKLEGWKRALRIVKLLLNAEYRITTGL